MGIKSLFGFGQARDKPVRNYSNGEYPAINITLKKTGGIYHDRFIVFDYGTEDERIFLYGASSKDAGTRVTSIVEDFGITKYRFTPVYQHP